MTFRRNLLAVVAMATLPALAVPGLAQGPESTSQIKPVAHFALSDSEGFSMSDAEEGGEHHYPNYVSTDPGFPRKPLWERPGDIKAGANMSPRYCQDECFRAGWPHDVRKRATCAINSRYSAWYVGGGSALIFPFGRQRTCEEGTWGLDYSLWSRPRTVWMRWTNGREQGGEGAYATDRE